MRTDPNENVVVFSDAAKRRLWTAFLTCIGVLALSGITPFAFGNLTSLEEELLGSVALIACATILVLANVARRQRPGSRIVAALGVFLAVVALCSTLLMIWDSSAVYQWGGRWRGQQLESITLWSWILAVALTVSGLLSLARLPWPATLVRYGTTVCVWALGATLACTVIDRSDYSVWQVLFRIAGALTLAGLFGIVATVVLHKRYAIRTPVRAPLAEQLIALTCPGCGRSQKVTIGESRCEACRLVFHIEVEAPICAKCGYLLYRLASDTCPECGSRVVAQPDAL